MIKYVQEKHYISILHDTIYRISVSIKKECGATARMFRISHNIVAENANEQSVLILVKFVVFFLYCLKCRRLFDNKY